jgi:NhaP-type Na+/H+ or K+/H+ antiporter
MTSHCDVTRWDWNMGLAFGAMLAATDPVAVVALLKVGR